MTDDAGQRLKPTEIFDLIKREGTEELGRRSRALAWSGLAAGLSIGFSMLVAGILMADLPDARWAHAIVAIGYTAGFQIVILGRQQLFTENTLTAILPVLEERRLKRLVQLILLWATVLTANIIGAALFAFVVSQFSGVDPAYDKAFADLGLHLLEKGFADNFVSGIGAGWMIASLVWVLPSAPTNKFLIILFFTWIIFLCDLSHIIAGSVEVFYYWYGNDLTLAYFLIDFFLPALLGNIIGGSALFALITYAQVQQDFEEEQGR